jgi:hypothetical protein
LFFDQGLGLLQHLVATVATVDEGAGEFAGLQGHVELQVSYVVAEVFALVGGIDRLLRCRVHEGCSQSYGCNRTIRRSNYCGKFAPIAPILQRFLRNAGGFVTGLQ